MDKLGYTDEQYKKYNRNMWASLMLFCFLYCCLYSGRLNMATAIPMMSEPLENGGMGWSTSQLGILSSILFWTYGFGHLVNGRLGEVSGVRKFIIAGIILSGITNIFISFQSSLLVVCILWGFNGFFQSMLWSPGMAFISNWWPGSRRGFAAGFANASSSLGTAAAWIAVTIAFALAPDMGWRAAFRLTPIVMAAGCLVFLLFSKESPSKIGLPEYKEEDVRSSHEDELKKVVAERGKLYPYIYLFSKWRFVAWLLIIFGCDVARYGLLTWMPTYYTAVQGVNLRDGIFNLVMLPLGMALGTWLVPMLSDRITPYNRLPIVIVCALAAAATVLIFQQVESQFLASLVLFVAGFFVYAIAGLVWAFATDIGGRVFAGTAAGVLDWAGYMGAALQAIFFGFMLGEGRWGVLFAGIAGTCVFIAVAAFIASRGDKEKQQQLV